MSEITNQQLVQPVIQPSPEAGRRLQYRETMLWSSAPYAVAFDLILAASLYLYFRNSIQLPPNALLGILALTTIDMLRLGSYLLCRRNRSHWYQAITLILNLLVGIVWGTAMHMLLALQGNPMVIAMAAGILLAGYILAYSAYLLALGAAIVPMLVIFIHGLLNEAGQDYHLLAGLLIVASLTFLGITRRMLLTLENMVQQQIQQASTVQLLETEKVDIEQVNRRLQDEVQQRKDYQAEAERQRKRAEAANMAKDEFLATMSHEIRTPLNGILPILDLLSSTELNPEQRDYLQTAIDSSQHLLRIIDDILDYSKIQAGKLELEIVSLNVREVVQSVMELMQPNATAKGLELRYEIDANVRNNMKGDPIRLRQILSNLVSNAIKFTEHGYVLIRVSVQRDWPNRQELLFQVKDTGIGIDPKAQTKLFRPFAQADASTSRLHGGTGLGLVICKRLVELMEGRIGVKSAPGKGSIFWFLLPLEKVEGDARPTRTTLYGCRTLLVAARHENETRHLAGLLQGAGLQVQIVDNGRAALQALKQQLDSGKFPELLVIDQRQLGTEAEQIIRTIQGRKELSWLPILIINIPEDTEKFTNSRSGVSVLTTPFDSLKLQETLNLTLGILPMNALASEARVSHQQRSTPKTTPTAADETEPRPPTAESAQRHTAQTPPTAAGGTRPTALLVEDNPVNLKVAARLVENMGLAIDTAENGQIALDKIASKQYDLVFMDCQMPVMDGYQATRALRQRERQNGLPRLPVIAMTANAMAGDRQKCLDAGMDDYLSKPIKKDLLQETIQRWLKRRQQTRPGERMNQETPPPSAAAPTPTEPAQQPPVLDDTVVNDLLDIMGEDFLELLHVYLRDAPRLVQNVRKAARQGDVQALITPAHSLKSSSANVGAMRLSALAKQMEQKARQGRLNEPELLAEQIERTYAQTELALQRLVNKN